MKHLFRKIGDMFRPDNYQEKIDEMHLRIGKLQKIAKEHQDLARNYTVKGEMTLAIEEWRKADTTIRAILVFQKAILKLLGCDPAQSTQI